MKTDKLRYRLFQELCQNYNKDLQKFIFNLTRKDHFAASGISVSFPVGFSIEFTGTVDKMLQYAKRIKSDGTMVNY